MKLQIDESQQEILLAVLLEKMEMLATLANGNVPLRPAIKMYRAEVLIIYKTITGEITQ